MIKRRLQLAVEAALSRRAAVVLMGPRQVGKTTLALEIAEKRDALYLDLESAVGYPDPGRPAGTPGRGIELGGIHD